MTDLSRAIMDGAVNTVSRNRNIIKTVAKVIKSDEKTNRCSVKYTDKNGKIVVNDNAQVDFRNAQVWFPEKDELVLYEADGSNGMILSRYTEDYSEIRAENTLDSDVLPDSKVGMVGGTIV